MTEVWVTRVGAAIETITDSDTHRQAIEDWQRHARQPTPVVIAHGPYDAGKSTLIKRILVEDRTSVPDWLTVSGDQETSHVASVTSQDISYVDTPGTATGNAEHDQLATHAVRLADVVVLVITPQLLADDAVWIRSFADGTSYSTVPLPLFPDGALLVVIAQSDAAGVDPQDSPDGFRTLCARKRDELLGMLALADGTSRPRVHLVAADAYGRVGPDPQPELDDYLVADWDGMAALRADLRSATERLAELREAGHGRYWRLVGKQAIAAADAEIDKLKLLRDEAKSRKDRRQLLSVRLDTLTTEAEGELIGSLYERLDGLAERAYADETTIRADAEQRVQDSLDNWYAKYGRKLAEFAAEADAALTVERSRPASVKFDTWIRELTEIRQDDKRLDVNLNGVDSGASLLMKGMFWRKHGMTLEAAREQIELARGKKFEDYLKIGGARFKSEEAIDKAKKWLPKVDNIAQLASLVANFAPLAIDAIQDKVAAAKELKRREQAREQTKVVCAELARKILEDTDVDHGWSASVGELRSAIEADPLLTPLVAEAGARIAELHTARAELLELLAQPPANNR